MYPAIRHGTTAGYADYQTPGQIAVPKYRPQHGREYGDS